MAEMLARDLATAGWCFQRHGAWHRHERIGRAGSEGQTIAVWGTGIDVIYPKENKTLAESILLRRHHRFRAQTRHLSRAAEFPPRNRILSGMGIGVLVVEAGENSGTRVTARCALEQDRDVFAVPGNVTTKNAWGPNTLIKQGAKLWRHGRMCGRNCPRRCGAVGGRTRFCIVSGQAASCRGLPLEEHEKLFFSALRHDEAVQLDELMEKLESKLPRRRSSPLFLSSNWPDGSSNFPARTTSAEVALLPSLYQKLQREVADATGNKRVLRTPMEPLPGREHISR